MRKPGLTILLFALIVGVALYYFQHRSASNRTSDIAEAQKGQDDVAALAVSELPPGVEDAWIAYVDKRVAALIQRDGTALRVHDDIQSLIGGSVIVSLTTPYQISCDLMGGHIKFGFGDDAADVTVFWMLPTNLSDPDDATPKVTAKESTMTLGQDEPALMVDHNSVAATKLREQLCSKISERLQSVIESPK